MILRPLHPPARTGNAEPVWVVVERSQRAIDLSSGCWLVPQPAHAALSGDIAAQLDTKAFPGITPEIVRAIALHDAGWSLYDAAIIQESRSQGTRAKPYSFLAAPPEDTVAAWTGSIEIAGKGSPIGAFLVSRHFAAIGQTYREKANAKSAKILHGFLEQERPRKEKLRKKLPQSDQELDRLVEALRFCDLLSLYIACGAEDDVEFPQTVDGRSIRLRRSETTAQLSPTPFTNECAFSIAAIRHPKTAPESSQSFTLTCRL